MQAQTDKEKTTQTLLQKEIIGRIITLQSVRYNGSYADCNHKMIVRVTQCNYTDLLNAEWTRLLVHEGKDDTIVLESIRYRNHYMDAHHDGVVKLTHSPNPPDGAVWAQWKLVKVNSTGDNVFALESNRYKGSYFDASHDGVVHVTHGPQEADWAQWMVEIGPGDEIKDGYENVASLVNDLDEEVELKFKKKLGTSITEGSSVKMTVSLGYELQTNFTQGNFGIGNKISINYSKEWQDMKSQMWSEAVEVETKFKVQPKQTVVVYQLVGHYGPLRIHSNRIRLQNEGSTEFKELAE